MRHIRHLLLTGSPAVAERPRDASCLSVASVVQYVERKFRFRFISASLRRGFHVGCDKQDSLVCGGLRGKRTPPVIGPITRYSPRIFDAPVRGSPSEYCHKV